ncbi:hypothetical protein LINGRAHAP2_LOCUS33840 [Linum grandiflorum]
MDKTSMKLVFLVAVLIFIAGETSNIGAEGRASRLLPCGLCPPQCHCNDLGYCICPKGFPLLTSLTSNVDATCLLPCKEPCRCLGGTCLCGPEDSPSNSLTSNVEVTCLLPCKEPCRCVAGTCLCGAEDSPLN